MERKGYLATREGDADDANGSFLDELLSDSRHGGWLLEKKKKKKKKKRGGKE